MVSFKGMTLMVTMISSNKTEQRSCDGTKDLLIRKVIMCVIECGR